MTMYSLIICNSCVRKRILHAMVQFPIVQTVIQTISLTRK